MPSLTETFITQTIEMLLNEAIARDERSKSLLKRLENKLLALLPDLTKNVKVKLMQTL